MAREARVMAKEVEKMACFQVPGCAQYMNAVRMVARIKCPCTPGNSGSAKYKSVQPATVPTKRFFRRNALSSYMGCSNRNAFSTNQ
mgnify:CR=1 FL=1